MAGRYKFSPQSSAIVDFSFCANAWGETTVTSADNTVTETTIYYPKPNLGIGYELSTGSHQFQLFICNADAIIHQEIGVYNKNDFTNGDIMFGFNITRQWGFR